MDSLRFLSRVRRCATRNLDPAAAVAASSRPGRTTDRIGHRTLTKLARKETKGLLIAATASVILVGGGGSLAVWNATQTAPGPGAIAAGELKLVGVDCGDGWSLSAGSGPSALYTGAQLLAPGDTLSMTCTSTIVATSENLRAAVTADGGSVTGDLAASLSPTVTYSVGGVPSAAEVTTANHGDELSATVTLTFDSAADNATQLLSAALSDYVVTLTQVVD